MGLLYTSVLMLTRQLNWVSKLSGLLPYVRIGDHPRNMSCRMRLLHCRQHYRLPKSNATVSRQTLNLANRPLTAAPAVVRGFGFRKRLNRTDFLVSMPIAIAPPS